MLRDLAGHFHHVDFVVADDSAEFSVWHDCALIAFLLQPIGFDISPDFKASCFKVVLFFNAVFAI